MARWLHPEQSPTWPPITPEQNAAFRIQWGKERWRERVYVIVLMPYVEGDLWELNTPDGRFACMSDKTYEGLREQIDAYGIGYKVRNLDVARWLRVSRDEEGRVRDVYNALYKAAVQFTMAVYTQGTAYTRKRLR